MRKPRMIINEDRYGIYHLISRIVDSSFRLADEEKTQFENIMNKTAGFCGISVLTYVVMGNHFHILTRIPPMNEEIPLLTLVSRYRILYGFEKTLELVRKWKAWKKKGMKDEILEEQKLIRRRMHNVSSFMKEVKQNFSKYYNKRHHRKGTLWEERFTSVIVEDKIEYLKITSTYIDLNSIRAGVEKDPRAYKWSGISKACNGSDEALKGIAYIVKNENPLEAVQGYCALLAQRGMVKKTGKCTLDSATYRDLISFSEMSYGELAEVSIGAMTRGCFIGSKEFVESMFMKFRDYFGKKRKTGARKVPCKLNGIAIYSARDLRKNPITVTSQVMTA